MLTFIIQLSDDQEMGKILSSNFSVVLFLIWNKFMYIFSFCLQQSITA